MINSSVLKDIGRCKQLLYSKFINDVDICGLLLDKTEFSDEDRENLFFSQMFPFLYTADENKQTQDKMLSFLCFEVDGLSGTSDKVKSLKITVWAYCHKSIMKYHKKGYSGTRVDILADMVERSVRESYDFGIGKLECQPADHFYIGNSYYGRNLVYTVPDFTVKEC